MKKIAKIIIIFGIIFLLINAIGYIFKIPILITILNNSNGSGGQSVSNIPTILSIILTIIVLIKHKIWIR